MRKLVHRRGLLPLLLLACATRLFAADAEIAFLEGMGEKSSGAERSGWKPASRGDTISAGFWVRTLANSQMGLVVPDRNQVRLKPNSELQLNTAEQKQAVTEARLKLTKGGAWSQARPRPATGGNAPRATLRMETAAASLSIRGTDWQVDVAEDGSMQVVVLSGEVAVENDHGQLSVGAGEAARAEPGKAPVKFTLVNPGSRVQWVSSWQPEPRRWLGAESAAWGAEVARIEAGEYDAVLRALQPHAVGDADAALLAADLLVHAGQIEEAVSLLAPHAAAGDARAAALRARALVRLDRLDEAAAQLDVTPDTGKGVAELWLARGELAVLRGDARAASAAFEQAHTVAASDARQSAEADYGLGLVASEREQVREARRALSRALATDPALGKAAAELAAVETFAGNLAAAAARYDELLTREGANYVALTGRGINRLKQGDPDAALADFMKAGLIEPRYARAWLYQGVAFYQLGELERALQAFARAESLDANDPVPHMLQSQLAADALDYDGAIVEARAAQAKMPYLRSLNQLASDQKGSANLGSPIASAAVEEWAGFYADQAYSPYWGGSHLFQADRYSGKFLKNSELMKGFLSDPLAFGAPTRFSALVQRPGHYQRLDAGYLHDEGYNNAIARATMSGLVVVPQGVAYFLQGEYVSADAYEEATTGTSSDFTAGLGWRPRHDLGFFLFGVDQQQQADIESSLRAAGDGESLPDADLDQVEERFDGGFNLKKGPENQLWLKAGGGSQRNEFDGVVLSPAVAVAGESLVDAVFPSFSGMIRANISPHGMLDFNDTRIYGEDVQFRHALSLGDFEWSWGLEASTQEQRLDFQTRFPMGWTPLFAAQRSHGYLRVKQREEFELDDETLYATVRFPVLPAVVAEAGMFAQESTGDRRLRYRYDLNVFSLEPSTAGESHSTNFNPRLGLRWDLAAGQQLRLVAQRWRRPAAFGTLAPVDTLGIALDDRLTSVGGKYDRLRLQYDAELTPSTFVEAFADREVIDNDLAGQRTAFFSFQVEQLGKLRTREEFFTAPDLYEETPIFPEGSVSSLGLAANTLLGDGASLYARYLYRYGENRSDDLDFDGEIPYVPHHTAELGGQLELMPRWLLRLEAVYRSKRFQNDADIYEPARSGVAFRVKSYWETADKHHSLQLVLDHLALDQDAMIHEQRHEMVHLQYGYRF